MAVDVGGAVDAPARAELLDGVRPALDLGGDRALARGPEVGRERARRDVREAGERARRAELDDADHELGAGVVAVLVGDEVHPPPTEGDRIPRPRDARPRRRDRGRARPRVDDVDATHAPVGRPPDDRVYLGWVHAAVEAHRRRRQGAGDLGARRPAPRLGVEPVERAAVEALEGPEGALDRVHGQGVKLFVISHSPSAFRCPPDAAEYARNAAKLFAFEKLVPLASNFI